MDAILSGVKKENIIITLREMKVQERMQKIKQNFKEEQFTTRKIKILIKISKSLRYLILI